MQSKYVCKIVNLHIYFNVTYQVLLELGADPRVTADDGATPEQVNSLYIALVHIKEVQSISLTLWQVAAQAAVEETLQSWDIETTKKLVEGLESSRAKRLDREKQLKQAAEDE